MKVLIADQKLVTEIYPMEEAIPTMRKALTMLAGGDVVMPLRTMLALPQGDAVMGLMPSYLGGLEAVGVKVVAAFPANFGTEYDTHQGVVLFFDSERGLLRAIVDATSITAIRTAAVSGLVTDLLANPDAGDLAIIGAGTQAHTHLQAMRAVRPVHRVRVYSLPAESAEEFAEREARLTGLPVEAVATAEAAVAGADLICTTTTATEPVVRGAWVSPGAHVNAVGAYTPTTRELDSELVAAGAPLRRPPRIAPERGRRVPHPQGRRPVRRRAPGRRDRRGAHRQVAGAYVAGSDHPVQVARHRHRGPGVGAPHLRDLQGA